MFIAELFETSILFESETVDVLNTTAIINPWPTDLARMLNQNPVLRALDEPGRFVVWPAEQELHQPVQIALNMDRRSRRYQVFGNTAPPTDKPAAKVGRFYVWISDAAHAVLKPLHMSQKVKQALGLARSR